MKKLHLLYITAIAAIFFLQNNVSLAFAQSAQQERTGCECVTAFGSPGNVKAKLVCKNGGKQTDKECADDEVCQGDVSYAKCAKKDASKKSCSCYGGSGKSKDLVCTENGKTTRTTCPDKDGKEQICFGEGGTARCGTKEEEKKNVEDTTMNKNKTTCIGEGKSCKEKDQSSGIIQYMCCGELSCIKGKCQSFIDPPSPPCAQGQFQNGKCQQVPTAFGNISTNPEQFIQKIFAILLSMSGGIALLLIMKSGYLIMTAQGKPEALQQGRDQLVAAIVGLIFLIFSFVLLQVIGVDILHIPGFK